MKQIDCEWCKVAIEKICGRYNFTCAGCRERVLMDESCKLARKALAARVILWGDVPDWQREPSCGCKNKCKRRESAEQAEAELKAIKQRKYDAY